MVNKNINRANSINKYLLSFLVSVSLKDIKLYTLIITEGIIEGVAYIDGICEAHRECSNYVQSLYTTVIAHKEGRISKN